MPLSRVIIELSTSRLVLTRMDGQSPADTVCLRFDAPLTGFNASQFNTLAPALKNAVENLKAQGLPAIVVASGPRVVGLAHSAPASGGAGAAIQAATLALESAADFALDQSPSCVLPITKDAAGGGGTRTGAQVHLVGWAVEQETLAAIVGLVQGAGLMFDGLIANDVLRASHALQGAAALKTSPGQTVAQLHLDMDGGLLTGTRDARLPLVRPVTIGLEALVDALVRPIRTFDEATPSLTLTRAQAEQLLFSVGIPTPDATFEIGRTIRGSAVLPALQPALQRLGVEVKQSLRFGLDDAARAAAVFRLSGPAAEIPRLQDVLAGLVGIPLSADTRSATATSVPEALVRSPLLSHALMPVEHQERVFRTRVRRSALVGAAIAVAWTTFDAISTRSLLNATQLHLDALSHAARESGRTLESQQSALEARAAMAQLSDRIDRTLSAGTDWSAYLTHVARVVPNEIKLRHVHGEADQDGPTVSLTGSLNWSDDRRSSEIIGGFIDRLGQSPVVRGLRLASTSKSPGEKGMTQNFEIIVRLHPVSTSPLAGLVQSTPGLSHSAQSPTTLSQGGEP